MHKTLVLATLAITLSSRPAEACRNNQPCPFLVELMAYSLGAAMVGGYAYGTGYFAYHDLTDDTQSLEYGATELAFNGAFSALFVAAATNAAMDGDRGAVPLAVLGLGHGALAVHGAYRIRTEWKDPGHAPDGTREWVTGIVYGANALVWTAGLSKRHGRTYGVVEASVNTPIAVGLGYLAIDRARERERGPALLYGGMAVLSGAFAVHGWRTALDPPQSPALDLLGTGVMPVAVSDGREVAPGMAVSGTW